MVKTLATLALLCGLAAAGRAAPPEFIPKPVRIVSADGQWTLPPAPVIAVPDGASAEVARVAGVLRDELKARTGLDARIVPGERGDIRIALAADAAWASDEAYRVSVGDGVRITAGSPRGLLWGAQTLLQGLEGRGTAWAVPHLEIDDHPACPIRELLLDPARSFCDLEFLRRTIRVMSAYKLNLLHLHLTDDQAWRFETRAFPKCTPPGALFYTQAELRDLVAFAARYGVEIVPEFDFPGHARAAVAAYPQLDCEGKVREQNDAILCPGKAFTWRFIEGVVAEAAAVFPSPYLHLGADEPFALRRWADCPDCREQMKERGVTTLTAYYHTVVAQLQQVARRHGRKLIVWDDALHAGVQPMPSTDLIVDAWTNYRNAKALSAAGYPIINSSVGPLYLSSYGLRAGFPLAAVREWDPGKFCRTEPKRGDTRVAYGPLADGSRILGGQACIWASDEWVGERRLYPRAISMAETLWSGAGAGSLDDFQGRYRKGHVERLHRLGVLDEAALAHEVIPGRAGRSRQSAQDFILRFEQRLDATQDTTGIYVRVPAGGPPEAGCEIGLRPPEGQTLMKSLRGLTGWHRFEVDAHGRVLSLTIDGCLAWSIETPEARAGQVALGGKFPADRYRNVALWSVR